MKIEWGCVPIRLSTDTEIWIIILISLRNVFSCLMFGFKPFANIKNYLAAQWNEKLSSLTDFSVLDSSLVIDYHPEMSHGNEDESKSC